MNREDKNKLIVVSFIVGFWLIAALFFFVRSQLSWVGAFILLTAAQQLYMLPRMTRLYCRLRNADINVFQSLIPVYNEYYIYTTLYAWAVTILSSICLLFGLGIVLPFFDITILTDIVSSIWGEQVGLNATFYFIVYGLMIYVLLCVARGLAMVELKAYIDRKHAEYFAKASYYPMEALLYIMMFFPVGRTFSMSMISERLAKMVEINDMSKMRTNTLMEER